MTGSPSGAGLPLRGIRSVASAAGVNPAKPGRPKGLTPAARRTTPHPARRAGHGTVRRTATACRDLHGEHSGERIREVVVLGPTRLGRGPGRASGHGVRPGRAPGLVPGRGRRLRWSRAPARGAGRRRAGRDRRRPAAPGARHRSGDAPGPGGARRRVGRPAGHGDAGPAGHPTPSGSAVWSAWERHAGRTAHLAQQLMASSSVAGS